MITEILDVLSLGLAFLMIAYLVRHYVFTLTVLKNGQTRKKSMTSEGSTYKPSVSILIPAHNEEHVISRILQRMNTLTYPRDLLQVVVVDDASTDNTGKIAEQYSKTQNNIEVMHRSTQEGGRGKAHALNDGLKHTKGEIIICFDADYYPQEDIVEKLVRFFVDPQVGAVQGRVTVLNEPQNLVTRLVTLERIGGYCVDQQARDRLGLIPQFGGTVGAIRRSLLESLGGWDESALAEDTDLTFRFYLAGYKIRYLNDAESYEEAVETWQAYWRQRYRWARGHMQCAFKYSLKVLCSNKLNLKQKIDGLLLLGVYFMPILTLLSCIVFASLLFLNPPQWWLKMLWTLVPVPAYGFVGNFAPFFEVGIGAYLDGRIRAHRLISLLIFPFILNIFICTKALADLTISTISGKNRSHWAKTTHSGNGNSYIMK